MYFLMMSQQGVGYGKVQLMGGGLLFVRWDDLDTWPCVSDGGGRMEGEEEGKRKERGVEEKGERSGRERREEGNISLSTAGLCVR